MATEFSKKYYPLGVQCGRKVWDRVELNQQFKKDPLPEPTFFRHLLANYLRPLEDKSLSAAELELLATLNQVLRQLADQFLRSRNCKVLKNKITVSGKSVAFPRLEDTFYQFIKYFPVVPVESGLTDPEQLVSSLEDQQQVKELLLEIILLYVQSQNPALESTRELFSTEEQKLQQLTAYQQQLQRLDRALPQTEDGFPQQPQTLLQRLLEPLQTATTLYDQLQLLRELWAGILPADLLDRISSAFEQYEQEGFQPGAPGEPEAVPLDPAAYSIDEEYADFSVDLDWMPRTVLLAKSTYVWLNQLSVKYRRQISSLNQIPDEELDELVSCGFTSLWLIGIWERSKASLKVKNLGGQTNVAASAYAIDDYRIAADLGGDAALENLRSRCRQRGLDLACDVVTNHTGIESALLHEHPDWFVQLPHPPYPGYRFNGPDLSEDPDYSMQIEDGYSDHSEAAVVCRYQQRHTGEVRFIYHGNDGTHLPWNDTAQLNYLLPEVREAMIQLIITVARRFRIIRFDAAMTLAKKHFQRLWYPLPGSGSGVPSRSDHAMSQEEFNRHFPIEFWRELVDRIRIEAPDTLLLAEAFWLMEGYFVRTLGMHRVYNSAFMNMLKQEENGKYRETLKNILAFDPEILQRFVNFMSNPDEEPAVEQFGAGDKYICVATMLATMPGLPMFGHGQVEGLHEKYGMEYLAPRWQERPDRQLVERHEQQIFPLLRQRALFSGAENFQLYDFISTYGVEEDIFVYSNRLDEQTVLILCNNSPKSISGKIGPPVLMSAKEGVSYHHACGIDSRADFIWMADLGSGQQFLSPANLLLEGGDFHLQPYSHRVLTAFTSLTDEDGRWQQLWQRYGDSDRRDLFLDHAALLIEPTDDPVRELLEIVRPDRAKKQIEKLIAWLDTTYAHADLATLSPERFLEIVIHVVFPRVDLESSSFADLADLMGEKSPRAEASLFKLLDRVCNHRQLRELLKCNYHQGIDWFGQQELFQFCQVLLHYHIFTASRTAAIGSTEFRNEIIGLLSQFKKALKLAAGSGYQVDEFLRRLDRAPVAEKVIPARRPGGMKILFVASEATPFAKSGGLADVAGSLPRALRLLGHDVRVILPCYQMAEQGARLSKGSHSVEITLQEVTYRASLKQAVADGVPYWFVDTPEFFDRAELYGTAEGEYPDNGLRFGFFARAVLEMTKCLNFQPDLIHLNDWQSGLIPVLLQTAYRQDNFFAATKTMLTIHNLGYQGIFPLELLRQLELPEELDSPAELEYFGNLSVLKGGLHYADIINTVSPTYCREIQEPEQGYGFDGILRERSQDLYGIINGLDSRAWDPATDSLLVRNYSAKNLTGKGLCKQALQQELGLEVSREVPIVAVVSRLVQQKGIDLIKAVWRELLERDLQFVLLGSGNQQALQFWQEQREKHPGRVSINLTFDEALSHRLYSAADVLLVPSLYEPCGLTQMIALRYGVLPVVRRTGGLADTVIDVGEEPEAGYGFVFDHFDSQELLQSVDRALELYSHHRHWRVIVRRGMNQDFSWTNSAEQYQELYRQVKRGE
ncbi:MAG: glycogen synthase GlgA [Desulfuromusa sp.]|nr:glycogen synthase GlgA [Desulfuromusa sp.]